MCVEGQLSKNTPKLGNTLEIKRGKENRGLLNFAVSKLKSVQGLAYVARVGRAHQGVHQSLASWMLAL